MGIGAYRRRKELEMLGVVKDLLILMISSSLISNVVLSQFLGLCPFLGVSKKVDTAVGMGGAVIFVITIASGVAAVIYQCILVPFDIIFYVSVEEASSSCPVLSRKQKRDREEMVN